jgi:hypothetical protein
MNVLAVFIILGIGLFAAAYAAKRRFGLLALALAAGSTLSSIWNYDAGIMVSSLGIARSGPVTTAITLSVIVLLPAVVLLFHGYTYKNKYARIFGSLCFTLLTLAFLVEPLGFALTVEGTGADVYNWLMANKDAIIGFGMILAVIDLFLTKPAVISEKKSKK